MCVCLMDKEKCEKVEKGKNFADHLKLLSPSLQCLCRDQSRMFGVGCGTGIHLVHYTLRRKYLVLSTTRKKKKVVQLQSSAWFGPASVTDTKTGHSFWYSP